AVACVAGNEHSPDPIPLGNLDAQVPEADVIKLGAKLESSCLLEEAQEIVLLALCVARHRRMEKPALTHVHSSKELPVALQLRLQTPIGRALRKALFESSMELARPKYRQHHALIEVRATAVDAHLLADGRARSVTADDVVGLEHLVLVGPLFLA